MSMNLHEFYVSKLRSLKIGHISLSLQPTVLIELFASQKVDTTRHLPKPSFAKWIGDSAKLCMVASHHAHPSASCHLRWPSLGGSWKPHTFARGPGIKPRRVCDLQIRYTRRGAQCPSWFDVEGPTATARSALCVKRGEDGSRS